MKRFIPMMAVALLSASLSAGAIAQTQTATPSKSDKTQATPGTSTTGHSSNAMARKTTLLAGEVRNWKAIDKNHDNLIEPEEMEAYLKQGKSASKQ